MKFDYFYLWALFALFAFGYPYFFCKTETDEFKKGYTFGMGLAALMIIVVRACEWLTEHLHFSLSWI